MILMASKQCKPMCDPKNCTRLPNTDEMICGVCERLSPNEIAPSWPAGHDGREVVSKSNFDELPVVLPWPSAVQQQLTS
jgi:hypothetical protein